MRVVQILETSALVFLIQVLEDVGKFDTSCLALAISPFDKWVGFPFLRPRMEACQAKPAYQKKNIAKKSGFLRQLELRYCKHILALI